MTIRRKVIPLYGIAPGGRGGCGGGGPGDGVNDCDSGRGPGARGCGARCVVVAAGLRAAAGRGGGVDCSCRTSWVACSAAMVRAISLWAAVSCSMLCRIAVISCAMASICCIASAEAGAAGVTAGACSATGSGLPNLCRAGFGGRHWDLGSFMVLGGVECYPPRVSRGANSSRRPSGRAIYPSRRTKGEALGAKKNS